MADMTTSDLPPVPLPDRCNYVAAFLTLACNLRCSYCINSYASPAARYKMMSGRDWLRALNRLRSRPDLPVTLQGGEPSLHPDFHQILLGLSPDLHVDVLTNLQFDVEAFMAAVPPDRVRRDAPYASIRVSYHPETMDLADTKARVLRLQAAGYSVGIWAVRHPDATAAIEAAAADCRAAGIDFRFKDFLGRHKGRLYGEYTYPQAVSGVVGPPVLCRTSELILGPAGDVFRCHGDLYEGRGPIGHILDPDFRIDEAFRACDCFGRCNPCDVKTKTNRFQEFGHTSVEIRFPDAAG